MRAAAKYPSGLLKLLPALGMSRGCLSLLLCMMSSMKAKSRCLSDCSRENLASSMTRSMYLNAESRYPKAHSSFEYVLLLPSGSRKVTDSIWSDISPP